MITIETPGGELIKVIKSLDHIGLGFHELFGFISEDKAKSRIESRKKRGFEFNQNKWACKFELRFEDEKFSFSKLKDCSVNTIAENSWRLSTPRGDFILRDSTKAMFADSLTAEDDQASWINGLTEKLLLIACLFIPLMYFLQTAPKEEELVVKKEVKPITVKLVQQKQTVNISKQSPSIKIKPLTKTQVAKRAVQRNLGFLGLVGSKDLTKAVGGLPQKLKKSSAGAGAGGDAGSGGEVLTGLGKGLKKTTVGNTGVAGLGGIGTKGSGGGAGGYGNTVVASGEGVGISAIALGSKEMILEGGLSRYAINATIAKYLSQVRRCYETQLNKTPGLEGLVTVAFQINGSGKLNYSNIKNSSLKSPPVEKCITDKMMSWKFPKPKGGVNVNINYPFMLRPVGT